MLRKLKKICRARGHMACIAVYWSCENIIHAHITEYIYQNIEIYGIA